MKRIKTDFSQRDEFDRLLIPEGVTLLKGESVILYDEDMEVRASAGRGRPPKFFQIHWQSVRFASFREPPPRAVQESYNANPISSRRSWPI